MLLYPSRSSMFLFVLVLCVLLRNRRSVYRCTDMIRGVAEYTIRIEFTRQYLRAHIVGNILPLLPQSSLYPYACINTSVSGQGFGLTPGTSS